MDLDELKARPIWQMTGEELLYLLNQERPSHPQKVEEVTRTSYDFTDKKYVFGISGLASLFGCSISTANRIKKSGIIDEAIKQVGRKIVIDSELALELAGQKSGERQK